ncbi:MAG: TRAP transporter substrate-binding protein [Rhizobiaceae bacterium]|nr:TRAP transporter substrate-binding protein [Rhizobiaceae bacterium]
MKRLLSALAGAVLASTIAQAQEVTIRLSSPNPASHPYTVGAQHFADAVAKATNGTVTVQIFPDNQLGSPQAVVQGVQLGTIDMGIVASAHLAPYNEQVAALDLPFLFDGREAAYDKLDGKLGELLNVGLAPKNIVVLTYFDGGFRNIFSKTGPIKTPGDLSGMKMRVINSPVTIDSMAAMGGTPVPLAWSELYPGLQQGVVVGGSTGITQIWSQKFFEVAKHVAMTKTVFTAGPLIISKRKFDMLTPEQQEAVMTAGREAATYQRDLAQTGEKELTKKLEQGGVTFNDVDLAAFRAAVQPVWDKYSDSFDEAVRNELTQK